MIQESVLPSNIININSKAIKCYDELGENIDVNTVNSFGEEWKTFYKFEDDEINKLGDPYFEILQPEMYGKDKIAADFGCGTGRYTKYIHARFGSIAAIDPSEAIFSASHLLKNQSNVYFYKASIDNLPFNDDYFDFGFSLGVLHHIPDTQKAMNACVKKVKPGGYFLVYLYYNMDNRGIVFKLIFQLSNLVRRVVSRMPNRMKKIVCDILAIVLCMPFVGLSRLLRFLGVPRRIRRHIPLQYYEDLSFYVIRNDSLDRFGTPLEKRFTKIEIEEMMRNAGLTDIVISNKSPYWHAVGKKK